MTGRIPFIAAFALAAGLAGCGTSVPAIKVTRDPAVIATAVKAIGQAPSAQQCTDGRRPHLPGERQVINSPELNRELRRILDDVRAGWTETRVDPPVEIHIIANDEYNGVTNIHNQIAINLGVLAAAKHRDEIAFMVAHEMAHAHLGHIVDRRQHQLGTRRTLGLINDGVAMGVILANTHQVNAGQNAAPRFRSDLGPGDVNTVASSAAGVRILSTLYAEVGDALYSREQESQADLFAFDRLMDTQQSVDGAGQFYTRLREGEKIKQEEIAVLRGAVSQSVTLATTLALRDIKTPDKALISLPLAAAGVFGPALENAIGDLLAPLAERYDPITKRQEILTQYEDAVWKNPVAPKKRASPFEEKAALRRIVQDYMEATKAYADAEKALFEQRFDAAARASENAKLQRLLPVLGSLTRARVAEANGKPDEALRHAEAAKRHPEATPGTFRMVATLLTELGQHRRALSVLDEAERRFCTREPFLIARAGAIARGGDKAATLRAVAECDATGDATIGRACYLAARPEGKQGKDGGDPVGNPLVNTSGTAGDFLNNLLKGKTLF